jgi:hypothetical protein
MVIQGMCFWRCCPANLCTFHSILKSCFGHACDLRLITCYLRNGFLVLVFYGFSHRSGVIGTGMYLNLPAVFAQLGLSCITLKFPFNSFIMHVIKIQWNFVFLFACFISEKSEVILMKISIMNSHQNVSVKFNLTVVTCTLFKFSHKNLIVHGVDVDAFKNYNLYFKHF